MPVLLAALFKYSSIVGISDGCIVPFKYKTFPGSKITEVVEVCKVSVVSVVASRVVVKTVVVGVEVGTVCCRNS